MQRTTTKCARVISLKKLFSSIKFYINVYVYTIYEKTSGNENSPTSAMIIVKYRYHIKKR